MWYLEQPIWNCLLILLIGLQSYFCFVSEGLVGWSKLFCAFRRQAHFAFLHPPFPVFFHFCATNWRAAPHSKRCVSVSPGHVPRSQDLLWEALSPCCTEGCCARMCAVFFLRRAMQNTKLSSPLKHLVLQLCNDSHQCHSFFSKLRVALSAAPQADTRGSPFTEPWVLRMGEKWDQHINSPKGSPSLLVEGVLENQSAQLFSQRILRIQKPWWNLPGHLHYAIC